MMLMRAGMTIGALLLAAGCNGSSSNSASPKSAATFDWRTGCPAFEAARSKTGSGNLFDNNASKYRDYSRTLSRMMREIAPTQARSIRRVIDASDAMGELSEMYPDPSVLVQPEILEARDKFGEAVAEVERECRVRGYPTRPAAAVETYVASPGDPKTHILHVTLHDVLPLDVYKPMDGRCITTSGRDVYPYELTVDGPDEEYEFRPLEAKVIPVAATLLPDGTCQATMTIKVPYAPRYKAGVGMAEHGATNKEPNPERVWTTNGSSQKITVLR